MAKKTGLRPMVEKIKARMEERGVKQNALATKLQVNDNRVTLWLQGTGLPDAYQAARIAAYLELPLDYLVDDTQVEPPEYDAPRRVLTTAQDTVLMMARAVSMDDPDPSQLLTAIRRLGITPGSLVAREAASPLEEPPTAGKPKRSSLN